MQQPQSSAQLKRVQTEKHMDLARAWAAHLVTSNVIFVQHALRSIAVSNLLKVLCGILACKRPRQSCVPITGGLPSGMGRHGTNPDLLCRPTCIRQDDVEPARMLVQELCHVIHFPYIRKRGTSSATSYH